jgi:D-amino peptidase
MKIYIHTDAEGISGIFSLDQLDPAGRDFADARRLIMADMNAAVDAAFAAGATEVVVCDTHAMGGQLLPFEMDSRATYTTPNMGHSLPFLDESFGGIVLLGHHARAGTLNAFLEHTMSSRVWFELRINGRPVGEMAIEAAWAGHYGVPVIAVSGDAATAAEARADLGDVECAVVKWAVGRNRARVLPPETAHAEIRRAVGQAVKRRLAGEFLPFRPTLPATVELTLQRTDTADEMAARPGTERVDARTIRRVVQSLIDICKW